MEEERHGQELSRRTVLKRIGAGTAIAWATPIVATMNTPAFAASPPSGDDCLDCAGHICLDQGPCGDTGPLRGCFCSQVVGNTSQCFCYENRFCSDVTPCPNGQGDCPGNTTCAHSCCDSSVGSPVCLPPCGTTPPGARVATRGEGPTAGPVR